MLFRVGIHLDDVIIEGDDIYGSGVNIAARLEGVCDPGEILISQKDKPALYLKVDMVQPILKERLAKYINRLHVVEQTTSHLNI